MEFITQGWLDIEDGEIVLHIDKNRTWYNTFSLAESIMDYFNYMRVDTGLGRKITTIKNANLRIWFSDEQHTLEEVQMNFEAYSATGDLITSGHYVGYSEYTITGFNIDELIIGGHDLEAELKDHIGQYCHLILTD